MTSTNLKRPNFFSRLKGGKRNHSVEQARLILLASVPCYAIALIALKLAGASYYMLFFIGILLGLLIIFAAVNGRQKADYHLQTLSNLVESMIEGDYTLRGRKQSNPAFQELLDLINQLADTLNLHKIKAEENQLLLEKIIDQMQPMLIAIDELQNITLINESAKQTLGQNLKVGSKLSDETTLVLADAANGQVIKLNTQGSLAEYILYSDRYISENKHHRLYLLTRAEKQLREKERKAWQGLIRVLSHELNNSLTPIATFSNTLLRKLERESVISDPQKFSSGLSIIRERAESLKQFITSYGELSHLPMPKQTNFDWREKLQHLTKLFNQYQFTIYFSDHLPTTIQADPAQFEQVFINLFKNAVESMREINEASAQVIELDAKLNNGMLSIIVKDRGTGIANLENLFVPFYTTKSSGSGIGLTLCQQILHNHNGELKLINRLDGPGAEATVTLPLDEASILIKD